MTAYWVSIYQEIRDEQKMAAYATLAGPALTSAGGRFIARGLPEKVYEGGLNQRVVIIEFDYSRLPPPRTTALPIRRRVRFWEMASAARSGSSPGCNPPHSAWSPMGLTIP